MRFPSVATNGERVERNVAVVRKSREIGGSIECLAGVEIRGVRHVTLGTAKRGGGCDKKSGQLLLWPGLN